MGGFVFVGHRAGNFRAHDVHRMNVSLEAIIEGGNSVGVKRIGLDDVGTGGQVGALHALHNLRLRDVQYVEVPAQVARMVEEVRAAKLGLVQLLLLDHRAHGAV